MKLDLRVAGISILCLALCGMQAPLARADGPIMEGVYAYQEEDGSAATWTINTTCAPDCVANVTTSPGHGFAAPVINGRPTVTRVVPDGVSCPTYQLGVDILGGGDWPVTVRQSWDPRRLVGQVDFLNTPAPCGIADPHQSFTLTKIG
ncbi:hypothetical protein [Mycobacterium vicinigordonae]|uniref:Secreted protein n=1 Tax=Mycobacterium vicinigordonae TaxID=1719132 RepID=A0A7D6E195_9MYCO|nr:hypothetical protein [Mycobacterium vicinigordonae]QLL06166.1 hypothetical protein H0P51_20680 [Mycobacterium vicinigordonae]